MTSSKIGYEVFVVPFDNRFDFLSAFDALHREFRLRLRGASLTFGECLSLATQRRLLSRDDARFLEDVRDLRNIHAHTNDLAGRGMVRIQVDDGLIERLERIRERMAQGTAARPFMCPWKDVLKAGLSDRAGPLMATMLARDFTHLPVVDDRQVIGIFDERLLFRAVAEGRLTAFDASTTVGAVTEPYLFDRIDPEDLGVAFVPRSTSLADMRRKLDDHMRHQHRISLAIITPDGSRTAQPLGLFTIWDIPQVD